ncbi:hypothetical protein PS15p_205834 [Mucor circinelloides]
MKDFLSHRVFNHPIFQDPLFLSFKTNLEDVMSTESTPQDRFDAQDEMIRNLLIQNEEPKRQLADIATG